MSHAVGEITHYLGGRFLAQGEPFTKHDPVTGQIAASVHAAGADIVDQAVTAAKRAQRSWARLPVGERAGWLRRVADEIDRRFDDFVAAEIADTGKSVTQARTLDVPRGAANFRTFAEIGANQADEVFRTATASGERALNYTVRRPLGVAAVIVPWNLPFLLLTWKVAPALVSGNTVVVKPSEETPSSAAMLAEVVDAIGLPSGVFNLVHGFGSGSAGQALVEHAEVDAVTFTGETRTGSAIMRSVAEGVKPVSFELGGKKAGLVFADTDLGAAVDGAVRSVFTNGGQVCLCTERLYVQRPIFDEFVSRLAERARSLQFGWPHDADTTMMPMISADHRDKVISYSDAARADGAKVVAGGGVPTFDDARQGGYYIEPTVLTGLPEDSRVVREEIFGPVCHVAPFDTEDEALQLANNTPYGLAATLWTTDLARAHRVAPALEAGLVWVNTWFLRDLRTPFGGVKLSGIGREGGRYSLDFYSEPSTVCIRLEPR